MLHPSPQVRDTAGSGGDSDRAVVTEERMAARWVEEVAMVEEWVMTLATRIGQDRPSEVMDQALAGLPSKWRNYVVRWGDT